MWFLYQWELQGGCCAICRKPESRTKYRGQHRDNPLLLCIDHDHETGRARQLLCSRCNKLVGYLEAPDAWRHRAYVEIHAVAHKD